MWYTKLANTISTKIKRQLQPNPHAGTIYMNIIHNEEKSDKIKPKQLATSYGWLIVLTIKAEIYTHFAL